MTDPLRAAAQRLKRARDEWAAAKAQAKQAAIDADAQGIPQTVIASVLGVDRARTLRRWLGK
jgi:hypothetical protein